MKSRNFGNLTRLFTGVFLICYSISTAGDRLSSEFICNRIIKKIEHQLPIFLKQKYPNTFVNPSKSRIGETLTGIRSLGACEIRSIMGGATEAQIVLIDTALSNYEWTRLIPGTENTIQIPKGNFEFLVSENRDRYFKIKVIGHDSNFEISLIEFLTRIESKIVSESISEATKESK